MPGQPMPERPPLDTLETRLERIEAMVAAVEVGAERRLHEIHDYLDALKDSVEERLWTLLKILDEGRQ